MATLVFYSGGWFAALLVLLAVMAFGRLLFTRRQQRQPFALYSRVADLDVGTMSWRTRLAGLPNALFLLSLACFGLALLDPRGVLPPQPKSEEGPPVLKPVPTEGIAIYLVLDRSGSMSQPSPALPLGPPKIDLLKRVTHSFITGERGTALHGHDQDLIGLIAFARAATVLSPLTLDHKQLLEELEKLSVVQDPAQDGTGIGYAIFKTVNLIAATRHFAKDLAAAGKPAYLINGAAIVLVTDGFQSPNPMDKGKWLRNLGMEEASAYAKANGVKLYIVDIEPALASEQFAPHRHLLERVTEATGGKFYISGTPSQLQAIYEEIDKLEASPLPAGTLASEEPSQLMSPVTYRLFPVFIACGLAALALAISLSTTVLRQVP